MSESAKNYKSKNKKFKGTEPLRIKYQTNSAKSLQRGKNAKTKNP